MSPSDPEPPTESSAEPPAPTEHVAAFRAKDGSTVIYDERDHTAWIQSKTAVDIDETR